jgi:3-hydroxyisobutyrate dehydrogenase
MVEHFVKDMRIAIEECRRMQLDLPGLTLAESLYARMLAQGRGRLGTQALVLALAQQSQVEWPPATPPQSS